MSEWALGVMAIWREDWREEEREEEIMRWSQWGREKVRGSDRGDKWAGHIGTLRHFRDAWRRTSNAASNALGQGWLSVFPVNNPNRQP